MTNPSRNQPQSCRIVPNGVDHEMAIEDAVRRVRAALSQIHYGEIIVKMEAGKPVWVDKFERERVG